MDENKRRKVEEMKRKGRNMRKIREKKIGEWIEFLVEEIYFIVKIIGKLEFQMSMRRGEY